MSVPLFVGYEPPVPPEPESTPERKWTERMVLDLLHQRYGRMFRNGKIEQPRYVCAEHVRRSPAWGERIADFMAADTWASGRYAIHGFEVKVSRADWLTELRTPAKAEAFRPFCDYWWLVVSDRDIVRDDLPEGWGLLAATPSGAQLRRVVEAPWTTAMPMPADLRAALLRAAATTARRREGSA